MPPKLYHGDALAVLAGMAAGSVNLAFLDPPYNIGKAAWDKWPTDADFLRWLDGVLEQVARVLAGNGSLYVCAAPQKAARVEVLISERFNVLNSIVWVKGDTNGNGQWCKIDKDTLRSYFPQTERIIFAEQYGADNAAMGASGYAAKCDELRGFVFEPLRAYFADEKARAGVSTGQIMDWFAAHGLPRYVTARHTFTTSQWELPTPENYAALRKCFRDLGMAAEPLRREYEDLRREYEDLRREYEDLRREYEDLRRPFTVTAQEQYTDVWHFQSVPGYAGKHPCEKPQALLRHVIERSSRPGDVILDPFAGSGATGVAALALGREFVGIEQDAHWHEYGAQRLARVGVAVQAVDADGTEETVTPQQGRLF